MVDQICLSDAIIAGAKEVFETMIFMDIQETSDPDHKIEGNALLGTITFKGTIEGCFAICCNVTCAKTIAANMLGMDQIDDVGEADICDALGEVTNMIMGSIKARIQDSIGNIDVSIPSVVSGIKLQNSLGDGATRVVIKALIEDEYPAELSLICKEAD